MKIPTSSIMVLALLASACATPSLTQAEASAPERALHTSHAQSLQTYHQIAPWLMPFGLPVPLMMELELPCALEGADVQGEQMRATLTRGPEGRLTRADVYSRALGHETSSFTYDARGRISSVYICTLHAPDGDCTRERARIEMEYDHDTTQVTSVRRVGDMTMRLVDQRSPTSPDGLEYLFETTFTFQGDLDRPAEVTESQARVRWRPDWIWTEWTRSEDYSESTVFGARGHVTTRDAGESGATRQRFVRDEGGRIVEVVDEWRAPGEELWTTQRERALRYDAEHPRRLVEVSEEGGAFIRMSHVCAE